MIAWGRAVAFFDFVFDGGLADVDEKVDVARVAPLELPLTLLPTTVFCIFILATGTPTPTEPFTLDDVPRELGVAR